MRIHMPTCTWIIGLGLDVDPFIYSCSMLHAVPSTWSGMNTYLGYSNIQIWLLCQVHWVLAATRMCRQGPRKGHLTSNWCPMWRVSYKFLTIHLKSCFKFRKQETQIWYHWHPLASRDFKSVYASLCSARCNVLDWKFVWSTMVDADGGYDY